MKTVEWWYCCLNVRERTILRQTCEGLVLTLFLGIPVPLWDALWVATGYTDPFYKGAFRACFLLEIATIDVEDVPTEVVRPTVAGAADWLDWSLFVVQPAAACLEGCTQSRVLPP